MNGGQATKIHWSQLKPGVGRRRHPCGRVILQGHESTQWSWKVTCGACRIIINKIARAEATRIKERVIRTELWNRKIL